MPRALNRLDLFDVRKLDFEEPDYDRFPCLRLAKDAMAMGGTAPAILNAANEVAVAAFLEEKTSFTSIPTLVEHALKHVEAREAIELQTILEDDGHARAMVRLRLAEGVH